MRKLGPEVAKNDFARRYSGFYDKFLSGVGVDIGYRGDVSDADPVVPNARGIELSTPNYDGKILPYPPNSLDFIFSSHCMEHLPDAQINLINWYNVVKVGGFIVIIVPHQYLYEKKRSLPSRWNGDHKVFYTPGSLLTFVEKTLSPNHYRVVHLMDNDAHYSYDVWPEEHASGAYEIELVLKKIEPPKWRIK